MRGGRFTVVVVLLCLAAALLLPQLKDFRQFVWQSFGFAHRQQAGIPGLPNKTEIAAVLAKSPQDAYLAIAGAQLEALRGDLSAGIKLAVYKPLAERFPNSPAVQFLYGQSLLTAIGPEQRKEGWGIETKTPPPSYHPRTAEESANLDEALLRLRRAAQLDPQNAAPQYYLAYALFEKNDDAAARAALQDALARNQWSTYSRENRAAYWRLFEPSHIALIFRPIQVSALYTSARGFEAKMRALARLLSALAASNASQPALFYYQSLIHLGDIMLHQADDLSDGLLAKSVIDITSVRFISPQEKDTIKASGLSREAQIDRFSEIRATNFQNYLLAQQQGNLAAQYAKLRQTAAIFRSRGQKMTEQSLALVLSAFSSRYLIGSIVFGIFVFGALAIWLLAGLIALLAGVFQTDDPAPPWRWGEWGILLFSSLGLLTLMIYLSPISAAGGSGELTDIIILGAVLLLLLLFPLIGGLLKTRQKPPRPAKARLAGVLQSYRLLMPPTFAVLLAAALFSFSLTQSHFKRWVATEKQMSLQGDVQYWHLLPKE